LIDALICGAGPAGAIAALVMARAGARVLLVDREQFPRDKLCGDTLNPGALALLHSLGLGGGPIEQGRPLAGMLLSGPHNAMVRATYGDGIVGRAVIRRDLDAWLLEQAIKAGARFEPGWIARQLLTSDFHGESIVRGAILEARGQPATRVRIPAIMTIAADGSRSTLARAAGLSRHPRRPRRWAFGVYATGVRGVTDVGEMHVRPGHYIGIAPITSEIVNVCVVTERRRGTGSPVDVIREAIQRDAPLHDRLRNAEFISGVKVLGPLAVEARSAGVPGLLLAGDAAGFIDPMTGDGLHLAMRGGWLAAEEALHAGESGDVRTAVGRLNEARRRQFGAKLRFNLGVRRIVASPMAIEIGCLGAAVAPGLIRQLVRRAGDV
jgi:flavin-dependent dehydrogenase